MIFYVCGVNGKALKAVDDMLAQLLIGLIGNRLCRDLGVLCDLTPDTGAPVASNVADEVVESLDHNL